MDSNSAKAALVVSSLTLALQAVGSFAVMLCRLEFRTPSTTLACVSSICGCLALAHSFEPSIDGRFRRQAFELASQVLLHRHAGKGRAGGKLVAHGQFPGIAGVERRCSRISGIRRSAC